ncbi:hypothetical protein SLH46_06230 [Draconibacterium sp. IB214405]|uniref:hypothetical protein n=1 Tax=Draconibacterium sp. IB214405 TaxID=3097352 RepID=UPI002A1134C3|nr:hypothetical protein [Draconibacterium sp. IB214405]MDX8338769.1 hypothetical protein [Draconibacterium sp. IB214405]
MATKYYSPSINIIRDKDQTIDYIPTRNGEAAFNTILRSYENGIKSFCLIGAYGTGKSAFILAFNKVLNGQATHFPYTNGNKEVVSEFIIGDYISFEDQIRETFDIKSSENCFGKLDEIFKSYTKRNQRLLLVVDEFGKHLEYAAAQAAEKEMFFFQKLAELINSAEHDVILLTTLHQPFEGYSAELSESQKKEWKKVSGRYIEVPFNEPVEQLLYLASKHIENLKLDFKGSSEQFKKLFKAIQNAKAFPLKDYFSIEFAKKIYPFDLLSASTLILAFQTYGQNERSLFNFLKADDYLGLQDLNEEAPFFALPQVYDYLSHNFNGSIVSKYNPHNLQWRAIRDAILTAESIFDDGLKDILKIIKTIGLLNIFGKPGQKIDIEFLRSYGLTALNINDTEKVIELLERRQLIRYQSFSSRFVLFKGTDFDITQALVEAERIVSKDFDFLSRLNNYFTFPILQAKKAFYETGTPRYFEFKLRESFVDIDITDSIDGYIQLIINDSISEKKLKGESTSAQNPILVGWLSNSELIKDTIYEIEKVRWVKEQAKDDNIVQKELNDNELALTETLNAQFIEGFYGENSNVHWYYKGRKKQFKSSRELNKHLSKMCEDFYHDVPTFKNESINRQRVQGTISSARRTLITHLLENDAEELLGFDKDNFPPQRTIYQSLIADTGIHRKKNSRWELGAPTKNNFEKLWQYCELFLNECAESPRKLSDLVDNLKQKPFGLKMGLIEIWVPLFLIIKQHDFAFYEGDTFVPDITDDTLDVAMKQPKKYFIHTFKLSPEKTKLFNQYRYFLNQAETEAATRETFIETVKPFLSFYKRLTPFVQQTELLTQNSIRLKHAIADATNPEKVFFEDIPRALGYSGKDLLDEEKIEQFALRLKDATRELSAAQDKLYNDIEEIINSEIGETHISFPENKEKLQERFKKIKVSELSAKQKVFYNRIVTALDDRKSWISSVAYALENKTLDNFTDKDFSSFALNYPKRVYELDNLTDLSKRDIDQEKEDVLKLEITSFVKGVQNKLIRLPKSKSKKIHKLEEQIKPILTKGNTQENIAILIKLLQDEIDNE